MGWFWSGLERGLNATFGWPQQMLMRGLRVAQDEDVDFFDEEGFADWAAVPIFGAFDPKPKYVGGREVFDRTFGRMGMEHSIGAEFAANLLTDPTFFMTGGLTAAGKAARATENARRTWGVTKIRGLESSADESVSYLRKQFEQALADPALKRADRKKIQLAQRRLDKAGIDGKMSLHELSAEAGRHELRISLPLMNHYGMGIRVAPGYESWIKLANDKAVGPVAHVMAQAVGGTVGRIGFMRTAFDNSFGLAGDFKAGFGKRGQSMYVHSLGEMDETTGKVVMEALTPQNRKVYRHLFKKDVPLDARLQKYQRLLDKEVDPITAAKKAFGSAGNRILELAGATDIEGIAAGLNKWKGEYETAMDAWGAAKPTSRLTGAGAALEKARKKGRAALTVFSAGQKVGNEVVKTFTSDIGIKGFQEAEAHFRSASADYQRYIETITREVLTPKMLAWAKATGIDPKEAEQVTSHLAQMTALPEELAHHIEMGRVEGLGERNVLSLQHFSARFARSAELMQRFAQDGTNSAPLRKLAEQLAEGFKANLDEKTIGGFFDGVAADIVREPQDMAKFLDQGDTASHHLLLTGEKGLRGRYIQFAPDNMLRARLAVIERKLGRAKKKGVAVETLAEEADRKAIVNILARRGGGNPTSKYIRMPAGVKKTKIPRAERDLRSSDLRERDLDVGEGKLVGEDVERGPLLKTITELRLISQEMERVAKAIKKGADIELSPGRYAEALGTIERLSAQVEDIVFNGSKEGEDYLHAFRGVRRQALFDAISTGSLRSGSPIGYLPFVRSSNEHAALKTLFDQDRLYDIVNTAMPTLGHMMRRRADEITLEDLNDLYDILRGSLSPEAKGYMETLDGVAKGMGLEGGFKAYENRPTLLLMNRLAQGRRNVTTMGFIGDLMNDPERRVIGGKVAGYIIAGEDKPVASLRTYKPRVGDGERMEIDVFNKDVKRPEIEGVLIEMDDGTFRTVGAERLSMNGAILPLGSPDLRVLTASHAEEMAHAPKAAAAFAQRASRGELDGAALLEGDSVLKNAKAMGALEGQYIMLADKDVMAGTLSAINGQWKHFSKAVRGFDAVAFAMKRWATVLRIPFHALNIGSTMAQAHTVGIGTRDTMLAVPDMMRFLSNSRDVAHRYDALAAALADPKAGRQGWKVLSSEFLSVTRKNPRLKNALLDADVDEAMLDGLVYHNGKGSYYTVGEIMEALRPVFATATREGLRGGSRVSQTLLTLRKQVLAGGLQGAVNKGKVALDTATETSEMISRLTIFFGGLRQGRSLEQAAKDTMLAAVDYASLTNRERNVFKRWFGFYAFARKFTPVAFDRFARDPQYAAALAKTMTTEGILEDQNGQLGMRLPGGKSLPVQRLIPQMDALRMAEVLVERGAKYTSFLNEDSAVVAREQKLEGEAQQPFAPGPLPSALGKAFFAGDPAGAMKDGRDLIWPLRVIFDPGDPFEESTMLERFGEAVSPLKSDHATRSRVFLRGRLRDVIGDLEKKLAQTEDFDDRAVIKDEIGRLAARYRDMDKKLK